jgi:hypothetical protein
MALGLFYRIPAKIKNLTHSTDDRVETHHSDPLLPNILQLSRNGLLRQRRQLSS